MFVILQKPRHGHRTASATRSGTRPRQAGISLIELMISITLGLLIMGGLITIFINNRQASNEIQRANQQIENGRYAMGLLTDDLRNAGYLAEFNPSVLTTPAADPFPCAADLASLKSALPLGVQGYDNGTGVGALTCLSDVRAGTDVLVVRRASTCAVGDTGCDVQVAGAPYFQASACSSATELSATSADGHYYVFDTVTANLILHQKDCATLAPLHQYRTHLYFVANNDKSGDGIPTLKRAELGAGGFSIVPLVEGIEDLQIEYGLDNPAAPTGAPTAYTASPDGYNGCTSMTSPTCTAYWRNVVAVQVHLLARNTTTTGGYSTTKTYSLGLNADGSAHVDGPFADSYKRHVYESAVRLNNTAGRNTP